MRHCLEWRRCVRRCRRQGETLGHRWMAGCRHRDQWIAPAAAQACTLAALKFPVSATVPSSSGNAPTSPQAAACRSAHGRLRWQPRGGSPPPTPLVRCSTARTSARHRHDARFFVGQIDMVSRAKPPRPAALTACGGLLTGGRPPGRARRQLPRFRGALDQAGTGAVACRVVRDRVQRPELSTHEAIRCLDSVKLLLSGWLHSDSPDRNANVHNRICSPKMRHYLNCCPMTTPFDSEVI